jgi:hypothetical protein
VLQQFTLSSETTEPVPAVFLYRLRAVPENKLLFWQADFMLK